ncbi:MAG: 2-C-methyl-D-erythritol 4-phosphate cytidylyltransferase, partial [Lachnospiraceae bacterium]|nr:2-C-methyl-D-erythritol 4-phosphate cytidylyltransferase [Lachnospiraceae bacterium]
MRYGAILAGGVGNRMKSAHIPKQFLEIAGKPIIIWTLERLLKSALFDEVIIAIHPEWNEYLKTMIR